MKLKAIKLAVSRFVDNSTAHGLRNVANGDYIFLRVMWLLATLASAAYCAFLTSKSIMSYLQFDVLTKISVINQMPSNFPAVKLCSINFVANEKSFELLMQMKNNTNISETYFYGIYDFTLKYYYSNQMSSLNMSSETLKSYGLSLNEFVISCWFDRDQCTENMFEWVFDPYYGSCYIFNFNQTLYSSKSGNLNGLEIQLYISQAPDAFESFTSSLGAHVTILNRTSVTHASDGFDVAVDTKTSVSLSRVYSKRLPRPYSECVEDLSSYKSELVEYILEKNLTYTQTLCYEFCYERYVIKNCSCYMMPNSFKTYNKRPCSLNIDDYYCGNRGMNDFYEGKWQQECANECPLECETFSYTKTTSFSYFPVDDYFRVQLCKSGTLGPALFNLNQQEICDSIKNGGLTIKQIANKLRGKTLALNIFYDSLGYTLIEEIVKTEMADLIAGIGGQCGLFLGISFLSFVELIDLSIRLIIIIGSCSNRKTNQQEDE